MSRFNDYSLMGFESASPAEYEELLEEATDELNQEEGEHELLADILRKDDYKLVKDISGMIRFEASPHLRCALTRLLGAMAKTDGRLLLEALVSGTCSCASWLFASLVPQEGLEDREHLDEDISLHLDFLTMIAVHFSPLPPPIAAALMEQGGIKGIVAAVLFYQEHEDSADITTAGLQALCALHTQEECRDLVVDLITEKENTVIGISIAGMLNRAQGLHMANCLDLLEHIFSNSRTANFFFLNDLKVVIDICIRQILDLSPGDNLRYMVLVVVFELLMNCTDYMGTLYKNKEILSTLESLLGAEGLDQESKDAAAKVLDKCGPLLRMTEADLLE